MRSGAAITVKRRGRTRDPHTLSLVRTKDLPTRWGLGLVAGLLAVLVAAALPGAAGAAVRNYWITAEPVTWNAVPNELDAIHGTRFLPSQTVFPTVTSGAFTTTSCFPPNTQVTQIGDQFGLFSGCNPYFGDVGTQHSYFAFIQKMRELRISNGTGFSPATYSPEATLTRGQLMTFLVRAFFP